MAEKKRTFLSLEEQVKVIDWMRANVDYCGKHALPLVAEAVTAGTGIVVVNKAHVKRLAKGLGIAIGAERATPGGMKARLTELEKRVQRLEAWADAIEGS